MSIPKIADYSLTDAAVFPENKVDWPIDASKAVLLIHDMQNYFVDFYGQDSQLIADLVKNIQTLKSACKAAGIPVVYTAQPGDQDPKDRALLTDFWGTGLKADPALTNIIDALAPEQDDMQYTKWRYSAFKRTPLLDYMQTEEKNQLIICGIYSHIGILSTALDGFMYDIKPIVIADAVADFSESEQKMALNFIATRCGYVETLNTALKTLDNAPALDSSTSSSTTSKLSIDAIQNDVADILQVPISDVETDENLIYLGLDSIRVMTLLEKWRGQGANITFLDLAEKTTIQEWWEIIADSMVSHAAEEA